MQDLKISSDYYLFPFSEAEYTVNKSTLKHIRLY